MLLHAPDARRSQTIPKCWESGTERFIAGPCKEVGDSCLKTPKLPKSLSVMSQHFVTAWAVAHQAALSMGFSTLEYCGGLPFHSPGEFSNPGIELRSNILQADSLRADPSEKPQKLSAKPFYRKGERGTTLVVAYLLVSLFWRSGHGQVSMFL